MSDPLQGLEARDALHTPPGDTEAGERPAVIRRAAFRVLPLVTALYFVSIMDRGNIGFAALTMNPALGIDRASFGFGVGLMTLFYALFETPSNLLLARIGARRTLGRIALLWGLVTMAGALAVGPHSFYLLRALLGAAEAGLFPGVILYLSFWFPLRYRAAFNTVFCLAPPLSFMVTSVVSGFILEMDGAWGLAGWQWLFVLEGLPAVLLGGIVLTTMVDRPVEAPWLRPDERAWLQGRVDREHAALGTIHAPSLARVVLDPAILLLAVVHFCFFCGLVGLSNWLPQIVGSYGLSGHRVGLVAAIPPVAGVVGMLAFSRSSDRRGERIGHSVVAMLVAAAGFATVAVSHSLVVALVGFAVANVGVYSTQVIFWTIPQTFLSRRLAAGGLGLINTMGSLAGFFIASLIGWLQQETGSLTSGFWAVTVAFLVSTVAITAVGARLRTVAA